MPAINVIHASGRWSLVAQHLAADVADWRKKASIISHTEIGGLTDAQFEAAAGGPSWDWWRAPNVSGQDECAVQWDAGVWSLVSGAPVLLTPTQHWVDVKPGEKKRLYQPYYAAVVTLRHLATGEQVTVIAAHFPTRRTPLRIQIWTECAIKIRDLAKAELAAGRHVIVAADWNAGWRKPVEQLLLKSALAGSGLTYAWDGRVPKVTDDSLIDGIATDLPVTSCVLLAEPRSAEEFHQPVLVGITLPDPAPVPPKETPVSKLPSNLPQILKDAGLKVQVHDGWEKRGRSGAFNPVGVLCHHTATGKSTSDAATVRLLINGRPDLPGPLCQLGLGRDGTVHIIAAGRANHGGKAKSSGTVAAGDANNLYVGIEAFNDGVGEVWPDVQYAAYVRLAATLSKHITGNSAETVRGHKETSVTGKIDPRFSMPDFRSKVAADMAGTKPASPEKEAPVANNVEQGVALIKQGLAKFDAARLNGKTRLGVQLMARAIRVALASGPKS